jgi:hypothetical protein
MTSAPTQGIHCTACGGPLAPQGNAVRVRCTYCGTTNDVASAGAVQVARKLDALGIRVPERPMTIEQIEEELASGAAKKEAERRTAIIVACVVCAITFVIVVIVLAAS